MRAIKTFLSRREWLGGFMAAVCFFGWLQLSTAAEPTVNSCVACHRAIGGVTYLEHDFNDWEQSVHAKANVGCEACHGGDASKKDKVAAHAGLKPSTDSESPVYFNRIPETCAPCHSAEFNAFKKSEHFKELKRSGRGPNCVTCHGSMANHILSSRDLDSTCTLCHKKPVRASSTMLALANAGSSLEHLKQALEKAKTQSVDVASQEKAYTRALGLHRQALENWHTFKFGDVLQASQEITHDARTAVNEIQLKEQQKKP